MGKFIFYGAVLGVTIGAIDTVADAINGQWQSATWDLIFTLFLAVVAVCLRIEMKNKPPRSLEL